MTADLFSSAGAMAGIDAYALQRSDLNGFLFAEVGVEASGMRLTVLSALARLGVDPWQEAGRLAKLPRAAAVDGLAGMIAAMPACPWSLADATAIAARLVDMLPARNGGLFDHGTAKPAPSSLQATRRRAVLLALATVLAGLMLNLVGQRGAALDAVARQPANAATSPATSSSGHPPTGD